ncbi:hypothetical protein BHF71_05245 [Vulcanibacillus modesticaldus]|uniref:Protein kinase domain-containing protein n=1 Tax=Vulcanibacillus modesticaldus TaxID=337097 RepID=A0A1D2YXG7_9BACI|nr:hypothetical protein [Vulcanibacillus modesticaldus]OEG00307.1 hypothetical protein BHF71_05245 [Vulcanibacillus modesticaldus]
MSMLFNSKDNILKPGTVITGKWNKKKYTVIRILGSGENGIVYLVQFLGKQYALKMSLATIDLSLEIQVIQRLNNTQGQLLGFSVFDIDDFQYKEKLFTFYVMPYKNGISIEKYLYGKDCIEYYNVFRRVLELLISIHDEGWVLGDIKPEHILIEPEKLRISIIDLGGVTRFNEGVRQFTELYDRGSWKVGNRKADSHYDLFALVMVFIQISIGKNKLLKIFKQSRDINKVYDIIRNINLLRPLKPTFKEVLYGKSINSKKVIKDLQNNTPTLDDKNKSNRWIEWLFTTSVILFILVFVHLIYYW